ncbi:Mu transposase C-terminal domain-containing protein [uncultured Ilyobacter sp.]|uniref:Mu transposase C-terminal domain-containing protein n=1 Tax=uncultured Ilyobacter sp. TaxID=544433 RepID=UPI0029C71878|nr:Mu transposase C-terminal domain-containing protein [uncultured Ilyobacter sp.]
MGSRKGLSKERYKIIEPFLNKEKKLKDIENEKNISYATLKRWVKAYKDDGIEGLIKKERKDKNQYRSLDEKTFEFIKESYEKNPDIKISSLYEKCCKFIKTFSDKTISYHTVYRAVNNLDDFVKNHASINIEKIKRKHQAYRIIQTALDVNIRDFRKNSIKKPYLYLMYDVSTDDILNYYLSFSKLDLKKSTAFLRDTIIKNYKSDEKNFLKPQNLLIDSFEIKNKRKIEQIKENLDIKIENYYEPNKEMEKFVNFLKTDLNNLLRETHFNSSLLELDKILYSYIFMNNIKNLNEEKPFSPTGILRDIDKLDILLGSAKRKVQEYGIRFRNGIYRNPDLKEHVGHILEIKYNVNNPKEIKVYFKGNFLCMAYLFSNENF